MRQIVLFFLIQTSFFFAQPKNITLLDNWQDTSLISNSSQVRYSGLWTFVESDEEYAVIGTTEGASFLKLSENDNILFIDAVEARYPSAQAITREYRRYKNYVYAIGDEGDASLQIIDISYLPDSVVLVNDIQDERVGKAHTIHIDSTNALLYLCSVTPIINGQAQGLIPIRVFSLENPLEPLLLWEGFEDLAEVHDMELRDQIAILNCGFEGIRVYDFSNPMAPIYISNLEFYQNQGYNHQGSLSPDKSTYVFADETPGTRIKKCAVSPNYDLQIQHNFGVPDIPYLKTPHNIYITNNLAYVAYYNDGLKIYDLRANPPEEIAAYDTHIDLPGNTFSMWGAWGIDADLPSNRVVVSDRISGLYLFDFERELFESTPTSQELQAYPNPIESGSKMLVRLPERSPSSFSLKVISVNGATVYQSEIHGQTYIVFSLPLAAGYYTIELSLPNSFGGTVYRKNIVIN